MTTPLWPIAVGAVPQVLDLSHNNPHLNTAAEFAALYSAGVRGVIHKLTQGTDFLDPLYAVRRPLAEAAGLQWHGGYHFCTSFPVDQQLAWFLSQAGTNAALGLCLDAEANGGASIAPADAAAFAVALDKELGAQCLRYGNASVDAYQQEGWHDGPLWWAKYGPEPTVELMTSLGIDPNRVVLWQETGSGRVAGETPVDLSFARDPVLLWGLMGLAAAPAAPVAPVVAPVAPPVVSVMPDLKAAQAELGIEADGLWGSQTEAAFAAFYGANH